MSKRVERVLALGRATQAFGTFGVAALAVALIGFPIAQYLDAFLRPFIVESGYKIFVIFYLFLLYLPVMLAPGYFIFMWSNKYFGLDDDEDSRNQ